MTFKQIQLVKMGLIAVALVATTITAVRADTIKPQNKAVILINACQPYRIFAEKQRRVGNRWEYITAKRFFLACLNSAKTKGRLDMGVYIKQHEKNDAAQARLIPSVPAEMRGNRYQN